MRNDKQEQAIRSSAAEYLTFVAATGDSTESMEMRYEDENIWLTQKMMSALYDVDVRTINEHIQKIYEDGELTDEATIRNFRIVQTEGSRQVSRQVKHYNLQMIIAVGFKVNNDRAVQFRKWANTIVKDYTIQGWAMDSDRLKNGGIINLPHPTSAKHPRMPLSDRAAQFAPFAALSGHSAALAETARLTDQRMELDEDARAALDLKQQLLLERIKERPEITATWFQPDEKKDGGRYIVSTGRLKRIHEADQVLILADGLRIPIGDIVELESECIRGLL